jgi:hypothetical protein
MGREYQIAFIGTLITLIALIIIGIVLAVSSSISSSSTNALFGIAYASLAQISLPGIGTLPLLSYDTILAMAVTDVTIHSSATSMYLPLGIIGSLPFAVGGVMTGYGFYAFRKKEENTLCLITSLIVMIGFGALAVIVPIGLIPQTTISLSWTLLIYHFFSQIVPITQTTIGLGFAFSLALTALILFVGFILLGATEINLREKTPKRDLMLSSGILTIIGVITLGIGFGLLSIFVAYILLAVNFNELRK